jgi:8-hydroxy-5-deazaflavin:NADPH oxidoreductase
VRFLIIKENKKMKIGILGTGVVGRTLAVKLNELRHEVIIGTRNVSETLTRTGTDMMGNPPFKEWHLNNPQIQLRSIR